MSPGRRTKAIFWPSGDQVGSLPLVNGVIPDPSALATKMYGTGEPGYGPTNAILPGSDGGGGSRLPTCRYAPSSKWACPAAGCAERIAALYWTMSESPLSAPVARQGSATVPPAKSNVI